MKAKITSTVLICLVALVILFSYVGTAFCLQSNRNIMGDPVLDPKPHGDPIDDPIPHGDPINNPRPHGDPIDDPKPRKS